MAKKQAKVDDIANWEDIASELPDIPALADEYRDLKDILKEGEARCKEISPVLEAAVVVGGKKSLACGDLKITQGSHPGNPQFKPEKLVEKLSGFGLTAEQITEALQFCVERKPYTYAMVTRVPAGVTEDE